MYVFSYAYLFACFTFVCVSVAMVMYVFAHIVTCLPELLSNTFMLLSPMVNMSKPTVQTATPMVYTCKTGQIPSYNEIGKTADNSKESCAAACDALGECGAFDFTKKTKGDACRLVKGDRTPRSDGGDDKRKYCKGTS